MDKKIKDYWFRSYKIMPPIGKVLGWGAKGVIYTTEGKEETKEFLGKTKVEAEEKAKKKIKDIVSKIRKKS